MKKEMLRIGTVNMESDLDIDAIEKLIGKCDEMIITKEPSRRQIALGVQLFPAPRIYIELEQSGETIRAVCKVNEANKYRHVLHASLPKEPESTSFASQKQHNLAPIVGGKKSPGRSSLIPNDIGVCYIRDYRLYNEDALLRSLERESVEIL
jgi:hypothetical protein